MSMLEILTLLGVGLATGAAGVVTVEKIIGLITPPKEDRIEEIEKAKAQSKHGGLRNPWD